VPSIFPFPTKKKTLPRRKLICVGNEESSEEIQDSNPETDDTGGSTSEWNVNKSVEPVQSEDNPELKEEIVKLKQMLNEAKLDLIRMLEERDLVYIDVQYALSPFY